MPNSASYIFSREALSDLKDIYNYHKQYSIEKAEEVRALIRASLLNLSELPLTGQKRKDLTKYDLRFYFIYKYGYFIIYDHNTKPINIVRIVSSYRDISALLN